MEPIAASPPCTAKKQNGILFGDETAGGPLTLGMHEKKKHHNVVATARCEISPVTLVLILNATERFFAGNGTPFYNKREKTAA
jgi:tRNA/tmRNA/rRNA uracil-C5-methylase (TrmA/RlmC/RlmD family)